VERTVDLLGAHGVPRVIVSIGPVTSGAVRAAGLEVTAEAGVHTLDGLVAAVADALAPG
jgi:uroporphyrinogen-III synthase